MMKMKSMKNKIEHKIVWGMPFLDNNIGGMSFLDHNIDCIIREEIREKTVFINEHLEQIYKKIQNEINTYKNR